MMIPKNAPIRRGGNGNGTGPMGQGPPSNSNSGTGGQNMPPMNGG